MSPERAGARPASLVRSSGGGGNYLRLPLLLADTSNGKSADRQDSEKNFDELPARRAAPVSCIAHRIG
jgi:hypothetical protein